MEWVFILLIGFLVLELWDYFVVHKTKKTWTLLFIVLPAIYAPFVVPKEIQIVPFIVAMIVFNKILKSVELMRGSCVDPTMLTSLPKYLFWSLNFPDTFWPKNEDEVKENRKKGIIRLGRASIKLAISVAIAITYVYLLQNYQSYYYLQMFLLMLLAYTFFSGIVDLATGSIMQTGIYFVELFDSPFLARSPRDFWGKRWNLYFRDVCHRNIFIPLGGKKHPALIAGIVFFTSAVLHEYLVYVCLYGEMLGYMTAFFMLHYLATILETVISRKIGKQFFPKPIAIILNITWMLVTIPLLMEPLLAIFPVQTWVTNLRLF